jgi:hypothetical protein
LVSTFTGQDQLLPKFGFGITASSFFMVFQYFFPQDLKSSFIYSAHHKV